MTQVGLAQVGEPRNAVRFAARQGRIHLHGVEPWPPSLFRFMVAIVVPLQP